MLVDRFQLSERMATANFTEDGQQKTAEHLLCSAGLTAGLHGHFTLLSVLNSFLSLMAFLGNAMIINALHKESSLHPPSKLLLRSLATTHLCVGLISQPLFVTYWVSVVNEHWNICRYVYEAALVTAYILCSSSLMILTAISVDRLLAMLLRLRYRQVVTLKRTCLTVVILWLIAFIFSAIQFWNPLITVWYGIMDTLLCLVTSVFSYTKIFFTLRRHQNQVEDHVEQPNQTNQLNIARYKKAVFTAIWLQLTLVACYLPFGIVKALTANGGLSSSLYYGAWSYTITLVFLKSSLNPILYCWNLEEVGQAVKDTIRQVLPHCLSS